MCESMLTTTDNPHDPRTHFDEWLAYDESMGYNTLNYLARVANVSVDMDEEEALPLIEEATEEIVKVNVLGIYTTV